MKHVHLLSRPRVMAAQTPLGIKLDASLSIIDRLLLAQRQAAWKVPFPPTDETEPTEPTEPVV